MAGTPHILLLDPAPERENLAMRLGELGLSCNVAHGLHDAMVQAILRNPVLIVADQARPSASGRECQRRLGAIPHFAHTRFLFIGGKDGELPADADSLRVAERVRELLEHPRAPVSESESRPQPAGTPTPPAPRKAAVPSAREPRLMDILNHLSEEQTDATITIRTRDGRLGELLIRDGQPIHAVTTDGRSGPAAFEEILGWEAAEPELGPPPRGETPITLVPQARRQAGRRRAPVRNHLRAVLAELEAVGVITRSET